MDRKDITRKFYDEHVSEFEDRTKNYLKEHILDDALLFIKSLKGKDILDIGCGAGRDALFFKEQGLKPLCVDISPVIIELCKKRGLEAFVMDVEDLEFKDAFDGIWAYTSLLHMPKNNFLAVLDKIKDLLKARGIFYLGMKEGDFEGWIEDERYGPLEDFTLCIKMKSSVIF